MSEFEMERPDSRFLRFASLYGPEGARTIVALLQRLVGILTEEQVLDADDVAKRIGVSRKTLLRLVSSGEFPSPVKVTGNRTGWLKSEFDSWLGSRPRADR
jgi:prophage regulatory protein